MSGTSPTFRASSAPTTSSQLLTHAGATREIIIERYKAHMLGFHSSKSIRIKRRKNVMFVDVSTHMSCKEPHVFSDHRRVRSFTSVATRTKHEATLAFCCTKLIVAPLLNAFSCAILWNTF